MALLDRVFYAQRLARVVVARPRDRLRRRRPARRARRRGRGGEPRRRSCSSSARSPGRSARSTRVRAPLPRRPLVGAAMQMLAGGADADRRRRRQRRVRPRASGRRSRWSPGSGSRTWSSPARSLGFTAYMWLLRAAPTSLVGTYAYVNPVVAVLLGTHPARRAADVAHARRRRDHPRVRRADRACPGARSRRGASGRRRRSRPLGRRLVAARGRLTSAAMTCFDLRNVRVRSGEEHREAVEVAIAPVELGGERYIAVPEEIAAELAVTRASTGWVFELRLVRPSARPVRALPRRRRRRGDPGAARVPGDEPRLGRADDAVPRRRPARPLGLGARLR